MDLLPPGSHQGDPREARGVGPPRALQGGCPRLSPAVPAAPGAPRHFGSWTGEAREAPPPGPSGAGATPQHLTAPRRRQLRPRRPQGAASRPPKGRSPRAPRRPGPLRPRRGAARRHRQPRLDAGRQDPHAPPPRDPVRRPPLTRADLDAAGSGKASPAVTAAVAAGPAQKGIRLRHGVAARRQDARGNLE